MASSAIDKTLRGRKDGKRRREEEEKSEQMEKKKMMMMMIEESQSVVTVEHRETQLPISLWKTSR